MKNIAVNQATHGLELATFTKPPQIIRRTFFPTVLYSMENCTLKNAVLNKMLKKHVSVRKKKTILKT